MTKPSMTVRFWGVRGSIPSPGPSTSRYGGNTSCVSIDLGAAGTLVLDAGTGIRAAGKSLLDSDRMIYVLVSHTHWDHIQGFPYFAPIYQPGREINVFSSERGHTMLCSLVEQMDGFHFPVTPEKLPSQMECITENQMEFLSEHGLAVSKIATNHPGGASGYRIDHDGRSVVYLTDNELEPPGAKTTQLEEFADFCRGTDVLIHDAQYLTHDMPGKHGWGHSVVDHVCELALAAEVKHLVLYHHDPERTDPEIDAIQKEARARIQSANRSVACTAAFEGLTLEI